ncbi:hypothetical protein ABE437_03625 [Isoptericola cucumis]|uniref:hypothetical protein n=1 Tax=Isoptericola cucumis TaxID=1776856 RepID=UPI00320817A9
MTAPISNLAPRPPRTPAGVRRVARRRFAAAGAALATAAAGVVVPVVTVATAPPASADSVMFCKELVNRAQSYLDQLPAEDATGVGTQGTPFTWDDVTSEGIKQLTDVHQSEFEKYRDAWVEKPAGSPAHAKWSYKDYVEQTGDRRAWKEYKPHYRAWSAGLQEQAAFERSALRSLPVSTSTGDWACPPMEQLRNDPNRPTAVSKQQNRTIRVVPNDAAGACPARLRAACPVDKELQRRIQQDRRAGYKTHVVTRKTPSPATARALRNLGASHSTHQARSVPTNPRASTTSAMKPGSTTTTSVVEDMAQRSGKNPGQASAGRTIVDRLGQNSARGFIPRSPGGIDWTSLELKYVTDDPKNDDYGYAFSADELPDDAEEPGYGGEASLNLSSDALMTWLALDPSQFWVNLNPDTPDTIVDKQFGSTDAGRVLLEADLEMKKTQTELMDPETETGKEFWDTIERTDDGMICYGWTRAWIEPQPAKVRTDGDQLYILDAPLKVQMEPMDIDWTPPDEDFCTEDAPEDLVERNTKYMSETFGPLLEEAVNSRPEYADLRRVYTTRVAAEWIKDRDAKRPGAFHDVIGSGDVSAWPARPGWDPQEVFDEIMELFVTPQYRYEYEHGEHELYVEVFGGIELPDAPRDQTSKKEFERDHPRLARTVQDARFDAVSEPPQVSAQDDVTTLDDEPTGTAWLGGGTFDEAPGPDPTDPPDDGDEGGGGGGGNPGGGGGGNAGDGGGGNPGDGGGGSPGGGSGDGGSGSGDGAGDGSGSGGGRESLPSRADSPSSEVVPGSDPMPATGFDDVRLVYAALALVLAGLALMLVRRRWLSRR